ncbi:PilZ domain-containing protein [Marinobacter daqiaonensis]|uniref:PilZ domain-containing protein n=1 Tax=Marinobacter daqiaonensis TaxID=650891 RepID=A0A1I6H253_9GAMM|nr:PilZ domain-containing protein [Marinobacter daqiaonensis]SFR48431.1 PilZ domain-containing protein [Marinobacter daqiaonensis]
MSSHSQDPDRRDFFRVEDRVGLEYRRLLPPTDGDIKPFDDDHLDGLKSELKRLDMEIRNQLSLLTEKDRLLTSLFKSLNSKVDTLARIMAFEQNPLQPQQWRDVTLSEGGVSFLAPAGELHQGDLLAIRLTLPPELFQPRARAKVVDVTPPSRGQSGDQALVHTRFIEIQEADRQQIAKHVMRWQIRQRQGGEPSQ